MARIMVCAAAVFVRGKNSFTASFVLGLQLTYPKPVLSVGEWRRFFFQEAKSFSEPVTVGECLCQI